MNNELLTIVSFSPQDLEERLIKVLKEQKQRPFYLSLAICDPQVYVCSFDTEKIPMAELKQKFTMEAVGLLSLPLDEVEFDLQILLEDESRMIGVYTCVESKLIREYSKAAKKNKLELISVTPHMTANIDAFFRQYKHRHDSFCLLDFEAGNKIHLSVFSENRCQMIRSIAFENPKEAEHEVIQTLRSASARSRVKKFNRMYCYGTLTGFDELIEQIERNFELAVEVSQRIDARSALSSEDNLFNFNFIREYSLPRNLRARLLKAVNIFLAFFIVLVLWSVFNYFKISGEYRHIKHSYTQADYDKAKELNDKVRKLK